MGCVSSVTHGSEYIRSKESKQDVESPVEAGRDVRPGFFGIRRWSSPQHKSVMAIQIRRSFQVRFDDVT